MLEQALKNLDMECEVRVDDDGERIAHIEALTQIDQKMVEIAVQTPYKYYESRPEAVKSFVLYALVDRYYDVSGSRRISRRLFGNIKVV